MSKFEDIRGVAFDLDGTLVDSAPGLAAAVDMALYALELPVAGEERVITWIGNGADVLMERALTWARQERATLRKTMGKPPVDDDIPAEEQVRILRKLFDRYYGEVAEEGTFLFPHVADTLGALQAKGLPLGLVTNKPTPFVAPLLEALDIAKYFSVVIGGDDVQNKKPHPDPLLLVAERMGIAPQQMLFVGDSRNDIQAAKAAQVDHFVRTLPDGYNTILNEEATNVSQGQKQLLTIARAILSDSRIMILDEATSSVDTRTELSIQTAMDNLMRGRTSFIIAHRLSTIRNADLILCMKDGDIVEQGTHEELLAKNGFYANLYNSQFEHAEESA